MGNKILRTCSAKMPDSQASQKLNIRMKLRKYCPNLKYYLFSKRKCVQSYNEKDDLGMPEITKDIAGTLYWMPEYSKQTLNEIVAKHDQQLHILLSHQVWCYQLHEHSIRSGNG